MRLNLCSGSIMTQMRINHGRFVQEHLYYLLGVLMTYSVAKIMAGIVNFVLKNLQIYLFQHVQGSLSE